MGLNAKQERFAQALVAEGMNASAAYKAAGLFRQEEMAPSEPMLQGC